MSILAQHGYGKTDKIQRGLRQGTINGVILSPRDESPDRMACFVESLRGEFGSLPTIAIDPQFYASTLPSGRDGHLQEYPYYQTGLTRSRFIAAGDIQQYAIESLTYQNTLPLSYMISPTIAVQDLRDPWSQIALSMGQESIVARSGLPGAPPLLLSLVLDENALKNREALNEYLDIISVWDISGVYLAVRHNDTGYPAYVEEETLINLMYLVYVLAEVNGFDVICGYTDLVGTLLHPLGARATCAGWYSTLRQFSFIRFEPSRGGRPPRARYTSSALINSLLIIPELNTIYRLGHGRQVFSNTTYDGVMNSGPANALAVWSSAVSCLHHWEVLMELAGRYSAVQTLSQRLDALEADVRAGIGLYQILTAAGVPFETASGPRNLEVWLRAIRGFRAEVGL